MKDIFENRSWLGIAGLITLVGILEFLTPSNLHATLPACHAPAPIYHPELVDSESHVEQCTPLNLPSYPPSAGDHYPIWASYQTYTQPVSPGFWLHSLEHGAVVLLYNCSRGCGEALAALTALIESLPVDPVCSAIPLNPAKRRVILAPDRHLDSTFYALAWGWSLASNCLDTAAIHAFYNQHYAMSKENLCNEGKDLSNSRWCNEPILGLKPKLRGNISSNPKPNIFWEGSMEKRGNLSLEFLNLNGQLLKSKKPGVPLRLRVDRTR